MLVEQLSCVYYPSLNPSLFPYSSKITKENPVKRVLNIDDDQSILNLLKTILSEDKKLKIFTANDPFEAMDILNHQVVDTIILDWTLPGLTGPETLNRAERTLKSDPDVPYEWEDKKVKVILFTGKERSECKTSSTRHFRYSGYVGKKNAGYEIILPSLMKLLYKSDI